VPFYVLIQEINFAQL